MIRGKILFSILALSILLGASLTVVPSNSTTQYIDTFALSAEKDILENLGEFSSPLPSAITVTDSNPFYALIATPLAVHYDDLGNQEVVPLYVKDFMETSKAVDRIQTSLDYDIDLEINGSVSVKETSLSLAETYWDSSDMVLLIEESQDGYDLGVVATPLASYLSCPILVTDIVDSSVNDVLSSLGVTTVYVCGDLSVSADTVIDFTSVDDIIAACIDVVETRLESSVDYITMTNPHDIIEPEILDSESYPFEGEVGSSVVLPSQFINVLMKRNGVVYHTFEVPNEYKYARIRLELENLNVDHVNELGDRMFAMILSPENAYQYVYASTGGGLPERDGQGNITRDLLTYEFTVYDEPGEYQLMVLGHWFGSITGEYEATVTVEKLDTPIVPMMKGLSSLAPYLTAYHKGVIFGKPEFAFAADDDVLFNGSTCPGVTQPGTNWRLLEPSNQHTLSIHEELLDLIGDITDIPSSNLEELRNNCVDYPLYIAIAADPTMVPMYFYYNPDGQPDTAAHIMGFALPSDFIYGDIDPKPGDVENNTYSYWPFQENIVGRVTGRDVQDMSALLARTFFYDDLLEEYSEWKDNALVQTGCGLEFQNLPFFTRLSQFLYSGRGEPTKFPTGEGEFINLRLKQDMEQGEFTVKNTFWTQSQREGFSQEALDAMKNTGLLSKILFPKRMVEKISSDEVVTGGEDHLNSNMIFAFAHGFYNLIESGDILMSCRGFPFVTALARIQPSVGSRLTDQGSFDVRSVENMEYGPSVIYIESCITARTDGINPENTLSQTFLHAGVNAYIGATRVTADPGYLEPRPFKQGKGFGILGLLNASYHYFIKDEFPDLHFGAVIAEDFILSLIEDDATTGRALRDAKNVYLEKDANTTFLWTPPLTLSSLHSPIDDLLLQKSSTQQEVGDRTQVLDKKYVALHEFTLYGDPAFNPYQPNNNG